MRFKQRIHHQGLSLFPSLNFKNSRKFNSRDSQGMYMLEVLVAISVGALMAYALLNTTTQSMRLLTTNQNRATANAMLTGLLEWSRSAGYNYLVTQPGENTITINRTSSNEPGSDTGVRKDVAMLDDFNLDWTDLAQKSTLNGKVTYIIEPVASMDAVKVTVKISWVDSSVFSASDNALGAGKEISASTLVRKNGSGAYSK